MEGQCGLNFFTNTLENRIAATQATLIEKKYQSLTIKINKAHTSK